MIIAAALARQGLVTGQSPVAANPFNTFYMTAAGSSLTFSETNQRVVHADANSTAIMWDGRGVGDYAISFKVMVFPSAARVGFRLGPTPTGAVNVVGEVAGEYAYLSTGEFVLNGATQATLATWLLNDEITLLRRRNAGTIEAFKNGTSQGIVAAGVPVTSYFYPATYANGGTTTSFRILTAAPFTLPTGAEYWI